MRILLTGSGGMVGKNILEHPLASEHFMLSPSRLELDLLNGAAVKQYLEKEQPDLIIHAAGLVGGIQANVTNPTEFLSINCLMGINLLSAASETEISRVLNLASSCMYPKNQENPLKESSILKGELEPTNEGYALAKIVATRMCEYISKEKPNLKYRTVIPCNLYGRHDHFESARSHLIPAIVRKIHQAVIDVRPEVEICGDGSARREFMYAEDLADFIFFAVHKFDKLPQNMNVGLGVDYSIEEYYRATSEVLGYKGGFRFDTTKPVGMKQKLVDISAQRSLGWAPKFTLHEGLTRTLSFYTKEKQASV